MKYLLSARFQRFKDELAQGEEGYLNYTAVKFGQPEVCSKVLWQYRIFTVPRRVEDKETVKRKAFFLFVLGKVL